MRAFLFLVAVLHILFGEVTFGSNADQLREIKLIRRAYIDITGLMPTPDEMEWYIVYCNDGYTTAIDYLFSAYDTKLIKEYVLSDLYKTQPPQLLSELELNKSLLYLTGMAQANPNMEVNVQKAKQKLVAHALECTNSVDDTIDYICNVVMSRASNVQENNSLTRKFKEMEVVKGEQQAWLSLVEEILTYNDVRYK